MLPLASSAACVDYTLTEADLAAILDESLDELRPVVLERGVAVDAANAACYLQMKVRIGIDIFGRRQSCQAQACSVGIADERKLGIKAFSISGCDLAFNLTGANRVIRTVYADVSDRIRSHCGTDAYRITKIAPQGTPGSGSVRLTLEAFR